MDISLITTNSGKYKIAREIFKEYNINLGQLDIETPEIQSLDNEEVAEFSAKFAKNQFNIPALKSDVGYFIPTLGGFPGPLVKFINESLSAEDILHLMSAKKNREIILRESLALVNTDNKTKVFSVEIKAKLAKIPSDKPGSAFDKLIILPGFTKPKAEYSEDENHEFFEQNLIIYHKMAEYISENITNA